MANGLQEDPALCQKAASGQGPMAALECFGQTHSVECVHKRTEGGEAGMDSDTGVVRSDTGVACSGTGVVYSDTGVVYPDTRVGYSGTGVTYHGKGVIYSGKGVVYSGKGAVYSDVGGTDSDIGHCCCSGECTSWQQQQHQQQQQQQMPQPSGMNRTSSDDRTWFGLSWIEAVKGSRFRFEKLCEDLKFEQVFDLSESYRAKTKAQFDHLDCTFPVSMSSAEGCGFWFGFRLTAEVKLHETEVKAATRKLGWLHSGGPDMFKHPIISHHTHGDGWELRMGPCPGGQKLRVVLMVTIWHVGHQTLDVDVPYVGGDAWYSIQATCVCDILSLRVTVETTEGPRVFSALSPYGPQMYHTLVPAANRAVLAFGYNQQWRERHTSCTIRGVHIEQLLSANALWLDPCADPGEATAWIQSLHKNAARVALDSRLKEPPGPSFPALYLEQSMLPLSTIENLEDVCCLARGLETCAPATLSTLASLLQHFGVADQGPSALSCACPTSSSSNISAHSSTPSNASSSAASRASSAVTAELASQGKAERVCSTAALGTATPDVMWLAPLALPDTAAPDTETLVTAAAGTEAAGTAAAGTAATGTASLDAAAQLLPLSLPNQELFSLLPHLLVPETVYDQHASIVLAAVAATTPPTCTASSLLAERACSYLVDMCGKWFNEEVPGNYSPELARMLLQVQEQVLTRNRWHQQVNTGSGRMHDQRHAWRGTLDDQYKHQIFTPLKQHKQADPIVTQSALTQEEHCFFSLVAQLHGTTINRRTSFWLTQARTPNKTSRPDFKQECTRCHALRSFTLLTTDKVCGLCISGTSHAVDGTVVEDPQSRSSYWCECRQCSGQYALVTVNSRISKPLCWYCRNDMPAPLRQCAACTKFFVDPSLQIGQAGETGQGQDTAGRRQVGQNARGQGGETAKGQNTAAWADVAWLCPSCTVDPGSSLETVEVELKELVTENPKLILQHLLGLDVPEGVDIFNPKMNCFNPMMGPFSASALCALIQEDMVKWCQPASPSPSLGSFLVAPPFTSPSFSPSSSLSTSSSPSGCRYAFPSPSSCPTLHAFRVCPSLSESASPSCSSAPSGSRFVPQNWQHKLKENPSNVFHALSCRHSSDVGTQNKNNASDNLLCAVGCLETPVSGEVPACQVTTVANAAAGSAAATFIPSHAGMSVAAPNTASSSPTSMSSPGGITAAAPSNASSRPTSISGPGAMTVAVPNHVFSTPNPTHIPPPIPTLTYKGKAVLNSALIFEEIQQWVRSGKAQEGTCMMCFQSMAKEQLHRSCGKKNCPAVACESCLQGWYGVPCPGRVITLPHLCCPFCKAPPLAQVLRQYNPLAAALKSRGTEGFMDDPAWYYGWCLTCAEAKIMAPKSCQQDLDQLPCNFQCEQCSLQAIADAEELMLLAKPCPRCGNGIVKTEGCDHISCVCGEHWCWLCGQGGFNQHNIYGHLNSEHAPVGANM